MFIYMYVIACMTCLLLTIYFTLQLKNLTMTGLTKFGKKNSTVSTNNVDSQRQENNVEVTFIIIHIFEMVLSFSDFEFGYCYLWSRCLVHLLELMLLLKSSYYDWKSCFIIFRSFFLKYKCAFYRSLLVKYLPFFQLEFIWW